MYACPRKAGGSPFKNDIFMGESEVSVIVEVAVFVSDLVRN